MFYTFPWLILCHGFSINIISLSDFFKTVETTVIICSICLLLNGLLFLYCSMILSSLSFWFLISLTLLWGIDVFLPPNITGVSTLLHLVSSLPEICLYLISHNYVISFPTNSRYESIPNIIVWSNKLFLYIFLNPSW